MSGPSPTTSPDERARQQLDHLVQQAPRAAIEMAHDLLTASPDDPTLVVIAWSGIGRALYELGDLERAIAAMRRATTGSPKRGADPSQLRSARVSAAAVLAEIGRIGDALRELTLAEQGATGTALGRILTQRAFVLYHSGQLDDALREADRAAAVFGSRRDPLGRLRLVVNRSLIHLQRGDITAATADLNAARASADQLAQNVITAAIVANLGVAHARAGRLATAIEHFDDAEQRYLAAGTPLRTMAIMETDRAEALRSAGRHVEAVRAATRSVDHAAESGNLVVHGDAELALAHSWWSAGDPARGEAAAGRAAALMLQSGRRAMALQTRALGLEMALARGRDGGNHAVLARARRLASRLEKLGWSDAARQLRSARLRHSWDTGRLDDVTDDIARLAPLRRSRRPHAALAGWYAESLRHWQIGDHATAGRAAMRGLERFGRTDAASGPSHPSSVRPLDAEVPESVRDLTRVIVAAAIADGRPRFVVGRTERMRELTDGHRDPGRFSLTRTRQALGSRAAIHYLVDGDDVWATVVHRSDATTTRVAALTEVRAIVGQLLSWLDRGATASPDGQVVLSTSARSQAERLGRLLLPDLSGLLDHADGLVIVPDDPLVEVPWSSLPTAAGQPIVVTRSLGQWCMAGARPRRPSANVTLLVGPDVEHSQLDRRHVVRTYTDPHVLAGRDATIAAARAALRQPGLVQLSAHGSFRADQPSMSSIRLADGEATLDELAPGQIAADLVVLASCETAGTSTRRGAQMHGFASELVRRGARVVVAPTTVVSDRECAEFVGAFHRELARGTSVGRSLAAVRAGVSGTAPLAEWAAASSFVCVGDDAMTIGAHVGAH